MRALILLACLLAALLADAAAAVETRLESWHDAARKRDVPVKLFLPAEAGKAAPIVLLSHGLGGNREGLTYLGNAFATAGYVVVHLQHPGSDSSLWKGSSTPLRDAKAAANKPIHAINRAGDVSFALDYLAELPEEHPLHGRCDLERVAIAGHSFGAWTALAVAGQGMKPNSSLTFQDKRIDAAIALSPPVQRRAATAQAAIYAPITIPVFHMTGTEDTSPIKPTQPAERRIPFDQSIHSDRYLLILTGGDHMVFSHNPRGRRRDKERDDAHQALIVEASLAFLNATLREDTDAHRWLTADDGLTARARGLATYEHATAN